MPRKKGNAQPPANQPNGNNKPVRDTHDFVSLAVQGLGVIGVFWAIHISLAGNTENGRNMANALGSMANIAETLSNQQDAIINQSKATQSLATETGTVAAATMTQAKTTRDQFAITQTPKIDVFMDVRAYKPGVPVEVAGRIVNQGASTVPGDAYIAWSPMPPGSDWRRVWEVHKQGPKAVNVVPGISRDQIMRVEDISEERWAQLASHEVYLVFATRFVFKDPSGKRQPPLESCITLTGPPEDMRRQSC